FRAARGGTLLLDEVAEIPMALQATVLRVLEMSEVRPVGATRDHRRPHRGHQQPRADGAGAGRPFPRRPLRAVGAVDDPPLAVARVSAQDEDALTLGPDVRLALSTTRSLTGLPRIEPAILDKDDLGRLMEQARWPLQRATSASPAPSCTGCPPAAR